MAVRSARGQQCITSSDGVGDEEQTTLVQLKRLTMTIIIITDFRIGQSLKTNEDIHL